MTRHSSFLTVGVLATAALAACRDGVRPDLPHVPLATANLASTLGTTECKSALPDSLITLPIAPPNFRVDLGIPVFSNPTKITNPLFPISNLSQVVFVGFVGGVPFRSETTLLPGTQPIRLANGTVETLTSQYVAYHDRRLEETALDWYGQDDIGAAWYFGEDVSNYNDGKIADKNGTWLACKDGPVAMIMPSLPRVGDVYRPENIFPSVFEEVEVKQVGQTVAGPLGPVAGAINVLELHLNGTYEPKVFAPGYGEFSTGSGSTVEALAIAIPTDASPSPTPPELRSLLSGARRVFAAAGLGDWTRASAAVGEMNASWSRYQVSVIPRLLKPLMSTALSHLTQFVAARERSGSRQWSVDVSTTGLDLSLQYRSRIDVDFARLDLWARQLIVDTEAGDRGGVNSDMAILRTILFRLANTGNAGDRSQVRAVERELRSLERAVSTRSSVAVLNGARQLQATLAHRLEARED
ncbi:MAG: hypothetical protein Q8K82_23035 [Gemmatimonadaceae bacterium]|nr:hypothetical protein [Gemmatimonadaceae bacterium]